MTIETRVFKDDVWAILFIVRNGRSEAADFIDRLPLADQKRVVRLVERIAQSRNGPFDLHDEGKFKRIETDLYEIKVGQVRLLCFREGRRTMILTHAFLKKSQRTPRSQILRARRMRDEFREERG